AANPSLYTGGAIRLVPLALRPGARELVHALATTLRWFLIARVVSMLAVGLLTWLTLWALGVPLAAVLGLIAGTLTFVPYAGPMLAAIPIVLVAFTEGVSTGLWALLLYTAIQSIEGFFITPYVQERAVALPPAMTLLAEVFMGVLFGAFGVVISVPLAAAALVVVRHVYLKGLLEEPQAVQETSGRG
ncbi:MAG: AI-2E family transporter, partial [Myxococcales bacterium]